MGQDTNFSKNCKAKKQKVKEVYGFMSWLKNRLQTSEFNNILNLLKTEKKQAYFLQLLKLYFPLNFRNSH